MSGLALRFALDDAALERELAVLIERGGDLKPALQDIGLDMVAITERAFELSRSPEGVPWEPSKAAKAEGRRTLIKTTNLKGSFSFVAGETDVIYGTNVRYAPFLQEGFDLAPHAGSVGLLALAGAEAIVSVPPRPFVGASDRDIARWEATLRDYLAGAA